MQNSTKPAQEYYTQAEAAEVLGISITRLQYLLDEHVFNEGTRRPEEITITYSDLLLLGFWQRSTPNPKVIRMPRRN
jgi:hypothetical protein